jgi:hypothetical protein
MIVGFVGITLADFGPSYGISKYVGLGILVFSIGINLYPQRPRKRRWLAVGTFFVLGETGFLLPAFWQNGAIPFISMLLMIIAILAAIFIPPRMPLWAKKETPEAPA